MSSLLSCLYSVVCACPCVFLFSVLSLTLTLIPTYLPTYLHMHLPLHCSPLYRTCASPNQATCRGAAGWCGLWTSTTACCWCGCSRPWPRWGRRWTCRCVSPSSHTSCSHTSWACPPLPTPSLPLSLTATNPLNPHLRPSCYHSQATVDNYGGHAWTHYRHNFIGDTALHLALRQRKLKCAYMLLALGASSDIENAKGETAADLISHVYVLVCVYVCVSIRVCVCVTLRLCNTMSV